MKATEYLEKYGPLFFGDPITVNFAKDMIGELFKEFTNEFMSIACKRHIRLDSSLNSAIEEQNGKWNALVRLFQKKYGDSPVKMDGFRTGINILLKKQERGMNNE